MRTLIATVLMLGLVSVAAGQITIDTVPVGNPGNAPDPEPSFSQVTSTGAVHAGAVNYAYRIGTYEVTAGQYTAFLNAVAATDTYGLYNPSMWSEDYGPKIQQSGSSGSYTYSVADDLANRPVSYAGWGDAARFANWLHNGQKTGDQDLTTTEDGAYYLNGAMGTDLLAVSRELDATWFLPTGDEWHKAAYHKNDGTTGNYFDFPLSSDDRPTGDAPPGGPNSANIDQVVVDGSTDVGAYTFSVSPYGTFDQGGNVWEHTEALSDDPDVVDFFGEAARAARGGYWGWNFTSLAAAAYSEVPMTGEFREHYGVGFRVATVPEPGGFALAGMALMGLLTYRRRQ